MGRIMKRKLPATPAGWLEETELAIADAAGEPFARLIREPERAVNLFHLAPMVCMKGGVTFFLYFRCLILPPVVP
jgi:hypothetical protein